MRGLAFTLDSDLLLAVVAGGSGGGVELQAWMPGRGWLHSSHRVLAETRSVEVLPPGWEITGAEDGDVDWQLMAWEKGTEAEATVWCSGQEVLAGDFAHGCLLQVFDKELARVPVSGSPISQPSRHSLAEDFGSVVELAVYPAGSRVLRAGAGLLQCLHLEDGTCEALPGPAPEGPIRGLGISREGALLFGRSDGSLEMRDEQHRSPSRRLGVGPEAVVSPDGYLLACHGGRVGSPAPGGTVVVHDVRADAIPWIMELGRNGPLGALAFSPDGAWLAAGVVRAGLRTFAVRVARVRKARQRYLVGLGDMPASRLVLGPGGEILAAGAPKHEHVKIMEIASEQVLASLPVGAAGTSALAFSPDGRRLAVAGRDQRLQVLDLRSGEIKDGGSVPGTGVTRMAFDGSDLLVVGGADGGILVYRVSSMS